MLGAVFAEMDEGWASRHRFTEDSIVKAYGKAAVSGYQHSDSDTSGSVTLTVEWNEPVLGQPTTFHVSATGGSGSYLFRMDAPSYSNPNEYAYESVADPSRGE